MVSWSAFILNSYVLLSQQLLLSTVLWPGVSNLQVLEILEDKEILSGLPQQ